MKSLHFYLALLLLCSLERINSQSVPDKDTDDTESGSGEPEPGESGSGESGSGAEGSGESGSGGPSQGPNDPGQCYTRVGCVGVSVPSTRGVCCDNMQEPMGNSFQSDRGEGCHVCPTVLGFAPMEFVGMERGENYTVQAGFLSGRGRSEEIDLELRLGTASSSDVSLGTNLVRLTPDFPLAPVTLNIRLDGTSQEMNETFSLSFVNFSPSLIRVLNSSTPGELNGTIIDKDLITIGFAEGEFRQSEGPNAQMEVTVARDQSVRLANPVIIRITPLSFGAVTFFPSSNNADHDDFDATILEVTLPADESSTAVNPGVSVFIPIFDDEVDEADEQDFSVSLDVVDATNRDLIRTSPSVASCSIIDNDDIRIGFAQLVYTFSEPDVATLITEVTLVREGGRLSEQTFDVAVTVGTPNSVSIRPATLQQLGNSMNPDYAIENLANNFISLAFPPEAQNVTFRFQLLSDALPEGLEAFRAETSPLAGSPRFQPGSTEIRILDDDFVVVGFEQTNSTTIEGVLTGFCVQIFDPLNTEELAFDVYLFLETRAGTAGTSDFTEKTEFIGFARSPPNTLRRQCYDLSISDDGLAEGIESFTVVLRLDNSFGLQTGVIVQPNSTEIFILDGDEDEELAGGGPILVTCFLNEICDCSVREQVTVEMCCSNMDMPLGFAYQISGRGECMECPIEFGFNQTTFSGLEQEDDYVVLAGFLSGRPASNRGLQIPLILEFDTASSRDVSLATAQITPFRNGLLLEVRFRLESDRVAQETDETFSIHINTSTVEGLLPESTTFVPTMNGTILDADEVVFKLVVDEFQTREQVNGTMPITLSKSAGISLASPISLRITPLMLEAASIFSGDDFDEADADDFDGAEKTVEFPVDEGRTLVEQITAFIPITDDDIDEADQLFVVIIADVMGAVDASRIVLGRNTSLCRITDNDDIRIGFSEPVYQFHEPVSADAVANLILVKNRQSEQTFLVTVMLGESEMLRPATLDDSTAFDYRVNNGTAAILAGPRTLELTFPPNIQNLSFSFTLNSDGEVEGVEGFQATISPSDAFLHPAVGQAYQSTIVQILDGDFARVGFEQESYTLTEMEGAVQRVCVRIYDPPQDEELPFNVFLVYESQTIPNSADQRDFVRVRPRGLAITANSSRQECFNVRSHDDELNERRESFSLTLKLDDTRQLQSGVLVQPNRTEIFIEDDDAILFGFNAVHITVNEADGMVLVPVEVTGDIGEFVFNLTVYGSIESGSASADADYSAERSFELAFSNNISTNNITISIFDDDISELDESFTLTLDEFIVHAGETSMQSRSDRSRLIYSIKTTVVSIRDDDVLTIGFLDSNTSMEIREDKGEISLPLGVILGTLQYTLSVDVETTAISASNGSDYVSAAQTFHFNNNNTDEVQAFNLTLMDDSFLEGNEEFSVAMRFDSLNVATTISTIEVTIVDNDEVVIGFVPGGDVVVSESDAAVQLVVGVLEGYLGVEVNVTFNTVAGTAQENDDYIGITDTISLTGNGSQTVTVQLLDGGKVKGNVEFGGNLVTSLSYPNLKFGEAVTIVIIDNDAEIGFFRNDTVVSESSGVVELTVGVLAGELGELVNISFSTDSASAIADRDYNEVLNVPIALMGNQNITIQVSLIDDESGEGEEKFMGQLELTQEYPRVQLTNPTITITILDNDNSNDAVVIGTVSAVLVLVLLIFILASIIYVRRTKKASSKEIPVSKDLDSNYYKYPDRSNELSDMRVRRTYRVNVPQSLVINSCNLQLNESVGQGEFGIVYKGRLSKGFNKSFGTVVAVKTLKGFLEKSLVKDLLEECTKMSTFDHPNVLTLIGVCIDGGPAPYIIMPFMFNGSLLAYLRKERENLVIPPQQQVDCSTVEVTSKLMDMCLQVAKGMEYLANKRLIHRDLAARNCMMDMNFVIKVADFGLSESTGNYKDYFRQDKTEGVKLPVKWLAPECFSDGVFSEKSDVWAFGVTCWEIFSGGRVPYAGINPMELPQMLESGYRMQPPNNSACTDQMTKLMVQCWTAKPEDRPSFGEIVNSFSESLESLSGYMNLCKEIESDKSL